MFEDWEDVFVASFMERYCDCGSCEECSYYEKCKFLSSQDVKVEESVSLDDDYVGFPF